MATRWPISRYWRGATVVLRMRPNGRRSERRGTGTSGKSSAGAGPASKSSAAKSGASACAKRLVHARADFSAAGSAHGAAAAPAADPAVAKSAQAWVHLFRQALAPDFAAEAFLLPDSAAPEPLPAAGAAVPLLSLLLPLGRVRNAQLAPRQYREIGQRVARAILSRW